MSEVSLYLAAEHACEDVVDLAQTLVDDFRGRHTNRVVRDEKDLERLGLAQIDRERDQLVVPRLSTDNLVRTNTEALRDRHEVVCLGCR